jgi:Fe-S cluster assembly protein SufD
MTMQVVNSDSIVGTRSGVDRAAYLTRLLHLRQALPDLGLSPELVTWWQELRDRAAALTQEQAIPSTREEEWRFTDLSALLRADLTIASGATQTAVAINTAEGQTLQFVNGEWQTSQIDTLSHATGLFVGNLATALQNPDMARKIQMHLAQQPGAEEVFTALNTASFTDAAVVVIPRHHRVDVPIQIQFLAGREGGAAATYPRCLVIAEAGSQLTLVEDYRSIDHSSHFSNAVTEVWLEDGAQVNHTIVQAQNLQSFWIQKTIVSQARDSHYTCNAITLGSTLSRHNLGVNTQGEQTETYLNGLTQIRGEQVADTHSLLAHHRPHSLSRQLHKCIVSDRGHAVFNGRVFVPKAAQLTNAGQQSRTLLLSPRARVDTKPQLEIVADNVKCAHGATVSQLEADQIFYLQSRGLNRTDAQTLLVNAFAAEIIERIPVPSLRSHLLQHVKELI